jgi:very-short-patch-repair endonuclease
MFEKYGVTSPVHLPSYERNYGKRSKMHIKIENILTKNNVKFKSEVGNKFKSFNTHLNREYSPIVDILIEDKKIVIEINGDMWHANPKKYKDTDMIFKWGGLISAKEIREFDKARTEQIKSFGYEVIVLWGSDIKSNIKQINEILNEKVF